MRRNCNLELRLLPPHSADSWSKNPKIEVTSEESPKEEQKLQKLTIFYNGRVCVSEVTEVQARAIIQLASGGEMDGEISISPNCALDQSSSSALHMKRSLQRFLQKRKHRVQKHRVQAASPY